MSSTKLTPQHLNPYEDPLSIEGYLTDKNIHKGG